MARGNAWDVLNVAELLTLVSAGIGGGGGVFPAKLAGEPPLTPESAAALRRTAETAAPGDTADAVRVALMFYEAFSAEAGAFADVRRTAARWTAGAAAEDLRRSLKKLSPRRLDRSQLAELRQRLRRCEHALARLKQGRRGGKRARSGRVLLAVERMLDPRRAWLDLPAAAETFRKAGHPREAARLREILNRISAGRLRQAQRRLLDRVDADLSRLEKPAPGLAELLESLSDFRKLLRTYRRDSPLAPFLIAAEEVGARAMHIRGEEEQPAWRREIDQSLDGVTRHVSAACSDPPLRAAAEACRGVVEAYRERPARTARVQEDLQTLIAGPAPRISARQWRRHEQRTAKLARRWFDRGLQATARRLAGLRSRGDSAEDERLQADLDALAELARRGYRPGSFAEGRRWAADFARRRAQAPSGELLEALVEACRRVESLLRPPGDHEAEAAAEALSAAPLVRFGRWVGELHRFVERRFAAMDEEQIALLDQLLRDGSFAVEPPARRDRSALTAWLALLPARQREKVLELLYLGPVRPQVLRAILLIVRAEAAGRRDPPLRPKRLAECAAAVELTDPELAALLCRDVFEPGLTSAERTSLLRHRAAIRRRLAAADSPELRRCLKRRLRAALADHSGPAAGGPFIAPPPRSEEAADRLGRCAGLEFYHCLWKAGTIDDTEYEAVVAQHWRSVRGRTSRIDEDRRRPSLVEMLQRYMRQTQAAGLDAETPPLSPIGLTWACWRYLQQDQEIAARWSRPVPSGLARRGRNGSPVRVEAADAYEMIEHVVHRVVKFFDLDRTVAEVKAIAETPEPERPPVPEDLLHEVRLVDLLLFELFGDAGALLGPSCYAAPPAAAVSAALAAVRPLAEDDAIAAEACEILSRLAAFLEPYDPAADALSLAPWARSGPESVGKWRELLAKLKAASCARDPARGGGDRDERAWSAVARTLGNRQTYLRLQLAMRAAVERNDPACRRLVASRALVAQFAAERSGLGQRRRLHERSEARIMGDKFAGRIEQVQAAIEGDSFFGSLVAAFLEHCRRLLALHMAEGPAPDVRAAAIACGENVQWWLSAMTAAAKARRGEVTTADERLLGAARAAGATARDLVDGYYVPKTHKGLKTLIPLRWGERLDDTLSRV